jgi:hypothetical protein
MGAIACRTRYAMLWQRPRRVAMADATGPVGRRLISEGQLLQRQPHANPPTFATSLHSLAARGRDRAQHQCRGRVHTVELFRRVGSIALRLA